MGSDDVHEFLGVGFVEFDIEYIDTSEIFEQVSLSFHHRLARQPPDVAKPRYCATVRRIFFETNDAPSNALQYLYDGIPIPDHVFQCDRESVAAHEAVLDGQAAGNVALLIASLDSLHPPHIKHRRHRAGK